MRKKILLFLEIALLLCLMAETGNAWVRSKMYDGVCPFSVGEPNAGSPGWRLELKNTEVRPGEYAGSAADRRWSLMTNCASGTADSKAKYRSDNGIWTLDPTKTTSLIWSLYIVGDADASVASSKCPQVFLRLGPNGQVKISYDGKTGDGSDTRGWYCQSGTLTSGGIDLGGGLMGCPMEPGEWHTVRLTMDPIAGTWDFWIDDDDSGAPETHLTGTVAADTGTTQYIQWGKIDSSGAGKMFFTQYCYWGQGDEISPLKDIAMQPVVTLNGDGTSATVVWTSNVAGDTRVVWGKDTYSWNNDVSVPDSSQFHSYTIDSLDPRATYSFYCTSSDGTTTEASAIKQFQTPNNVTAALGNPGFEEGASVYPWEDVIPPGTGDWQRWGGSLSAYGPIVPRTGKMWSGSMAGSYVERDWACLRQQVAVTPGKAYLARVWFYDDFMPSGTWSYSDVAGRVGLDPTGGTMPGQLDTGNIWTDAPAVYWSPWAYRPSTSAGWVEATALCVAESPVMTVYLQQHYVPYIMVYSAFDDADIAEGPMPPTDCAGCKNWTPGYQVTLKDVVVTARRQYIDGRVIGYVEDPDRKAGIRVSCSADTAAVWGASLGVGSEVDVTGTLQMNEHKELEIVPKSIASAIAPTNGQISPLAVTNKNVGGGANGVQIGVENGTGTNNTGLLVKVWGRVTAVGVPFDMTMDYPVFIDDGSNLTGGQDMSDPPTTYPGIEVKIPGELWIDPGQFVPGQSYLYVTGISSMKTWNSVQKPVILIRDANDIEFGQP